MFNVVTDADGIAAAVLVRALEPTAGIELMTRRRGTGMAPRDLCSGPGKLCEALGIELSQTRSPVWEPPFTLEPREDPDAVEIVPGPRIGITKGIQLPWRYCRAGSRFLSRPAG